MQANRSKTSSLEVFDNVTFDLKVAFLVQNCNLLTIRAKVRKPKLTERTRVVIIDVWDIFLLRKAKFEDLVSFARCYGPPWRFVPFSNYGECSDNLHYCVRATCLLFMCYSNLQKPSCRSVPELLLSDHQRHNPRNSKGSCAWLFAERRSCTCSNGCGKNSCGYRVLWSRVRMCSGIQQLPCFLCAHMGTILWIVTRSSYYYWMLYVLKPHPQLGYPFNALPHQLYLWLEAWTRIVCKQTWVTVGLPYQSFW